MMMILIQGKHGSWVQAVEKVVKYKEQVNIFKNIFRSRKS